MSSKYKMSKKKNIYSNGYCDRHRIITTYYFYNCYHLHSL